MTTPRPPAPYQDVTGRRAPVLPAGGGDPARLIDALEGLFREQAAMLREMRNEGANERIRAERDVRTGRLPRDVGTNGSSAVREITEAVREGVREAVREVEQTRPERRRATRPQGPAEGPEEPPGRRGNRRASRPQGAADPEATSPVSDPTSGARRTDEMAPDAPDATSDMRRRREQEARAAAARQGQVRRSIHERVGQRISEVGERRLERGPQLATNIQTERLHHVNPDGSLGAEASEEEANAFQRATRTARVFRNYGGSIAQGGSAREIMERALPGGAVRAAGVAGAVYTAAGQVADRMAQQNAANMEFQAIQGGDGPAVFNTDSYRERFEMAMARGGLTARFRQATGGLSADQAQEAFMGATNLGLGGGERQQVLELATENMRKFGMEVSESMRLVTAATQSGSAGLQGISEALESVTEAAVRGGRNARQARADFVAAYEQAAPMFTGQGAAATVAGGVAAANASMGRGFEGVNLGAGLGDPMFMRRVAATTGQSLSDVVLNSQGREGGQEFLQQSRAMRDRAILGQFGPEAQQMIAEATRNGPLDNASATDLARRVAEVSPNLDPEVMASLLGQFGVSGANLNNSIQTALMSVTGSADPAREARQIAGEQANRQLERTTRLVDDGMGGQMEVEGYDTSDIKKNIGDTGYSLMESLGRGNEDEDARNAYLHQVGRTGKASPLIEQMLKGGDSDQRFVVKAAKKDGKGTYDRVVNAEEAVRHFSDQLARGDVQIAAGTGKGQTLADAYGFEVDENMEITSDDKVGAGNKAGRSKSNYDKENAEGGKGGVVTISPAPELARLLQFSGSGSVAIGATAPPESHVPAAYLPSGTPGVTR